MIFFTDECISKNAAYMLNHFELKYEVRAYSDYFTQGTPDSEWMQKVASWDDVTVAICGDGRILKNKVERQVLKECDLMFVLLASGWTTLQWTVFGWKIVKAWPDIVRNVEQARYPTVFEVTVGNLKVRSRGRTSDL